MYLIVSVLMLLENLLYHYLTEPQRKRYSAMVAVAKNRERREKNHKKAMKQLRDDRKKKPPPLVIYWRGGASQVELRGTFTEPYWQETLKLEKEIDSDTWKLDLSNFGLAAGTYLFKFVVDGVWRVSQEYLSCFDKDGNENNNIFISSCRRPLKHIHSQPMMCKASSRSPSSGKTNLRRSSDDAVCFPKFYSSVEPVPGLFDSDKWKTVMHERSRKDLAFLCGAWMIPHPEKMNSGGADAFFYSPSSFGVADGVGEWEFKFKINPRKFAEELMKGAMETSFTIATDTENFKSPQSRAMECLKCGYDSTYSFGSSTAAVCVVDAEGTSVGVSNLGDSGITHLRKICVGQNASFSHVMKTADQQHAWNMPYQLTRVPHPNDYDTLELDPLYTTCIQELRKCGGAKILNMIDSVSAADLYESDIFEGDLLLGMTDGVKDNIWGHEIIRIINGVVSPFDAKIIGTKAFTDPEAIAKKIAIASFEKSQTCHYRSPFEVEMRRRTGGAYTGGKPDDISVVACWVVRKSDIQVLTETLERPRPSMTAPQWWRERSSK